MYYYYSRLQLEAQLQNRRTRCYVNGKEYTECGSKSCCRWSDAILILVDLDGTAERTYK